MVSFYEPLNQNKMKKHNTGNAFMDFIYDVTKQMEEEAFPCPKCGSHDLATDDNGDYEFYFCTEMDPECGWESKPGEYGLRVHKDEN